MRMNARRTAGLLAVALLGTSCAAFGAADGSQLGLPEGADVAIAVFEDLQCPDCRRAHPELLKAADALAVPLVIHDFPIVRHKWAFPAAILARYFETQSPELGVRFRSYIFENQPDINTWNLREYGETFSEAFEVTLPADVDPDGVLHARVQADFDLGQRIGLEYVPLMFVLGRSQGATRFVEVTDVAKVGEAVTQMRQAVAR
jgi:protein-disulfide isomerase